MFNAEIKCQTLITGCYRTGSEYLTLLINNHPHISATFYTLNFMRFCFERYNPIGKKENQVKLIQDSLEKLRVRFGREVRIEEVTRFLPEGGVSYADLYQALILGLHYYPGMTHWAEKTQLVWTKIPDFLRMYSNGKAIHIIRDPRSVLASFKRYTNSPPPRYMGAVFNCLGSMQHAQQYKREYPPNRYKLIRYEDLAQDSEHVMREVFDFLELEVSHDILNTDGWKDNHNQPWVANTAFGDPKVFSVQESVERWKHHLASAEILMCEMINCPDMEQFGYERSGMSVRSTDLGEEFKSILNDQQISSFLSLWASEGKGVESFPTDPFDSRNWEDVKIRESLEGKLPDSE